MIEDNFKDFEDVIKDKILDKEFLLDYHKRLCTHTINLELPT